VVTKGTRQLTTRLQQYKNTSMYGKSAAILLTSDTATVAHDWSFTWDMENCISLA